MGTSCDDSGHDLIKLIVFHLAVLYQLEVRGLL